MHDRLARAEPAADHDLGVQPAVPAPRGLAPDHDEQPARVRGGRGGRRRLGLARRRFSSTRRPGSAPARTVTAPPAAPLGRERLDDRGPVVSHSGRSWPPPGAPVAGEHLVGRLGPPLAGPVGRRLGAGPERPPAGRSPASDASTSAACGNSVASPSSTSRISRSYASGQDSVNASPYWKSIAMSRTSIVVPGTLEPNLSVTPSSGCTRMTSWLWPSSSVSVVVERQVRRLLEQDRDLGDPARQPLAGAQVERHAGPAPVLDAQPDRHVRLGGGVRRDVLLLEVADGALAGHPALAGTARGRCRSRCRRAA